MWCCIDMSLNAYAVYHSAIQYLHTSYYYMVNTLDMDAMIYLLCEGSHLSHLPTLGDVKHLMTKVNKALKIETITCIIEASPKYDKP